MHFMRKRCAIILGLISVFSLLACESDTENPNIVLFLADDLSYADLGCHDHPVVRTPHVDQLAKEGLSLTHMFTPTAMCAPSRSALYTGLYPHRNGCHMNHGSVRENISSLPYYLQPLGYRVALVNKRHIKPATAFPFDYVHKDSVEQYIQSIGGESFCLIYASDEPHGPHMDGRIKEADVSVPPTWVDTPEARDNYARYLNDVEAMDTEFGSLINLLKKEGLYEDAVTIFTSDHGFEYFAKWSCYEAGLRVPFFIRWNKIKPGTTNQAMVSFIDILPTLVELSGGPVPDNIDGKSAISVLLDHKEEHRDLIFGAHTNRGIISGKAYPIRSVRDRRFKYIMNLNSDNLFQNILTHGRTYRQEDAGPVWKSWSSLANEDPATADRVSFFLKRPKEELYDLLNDPNELNNLAEDPALLEIKSSLKSSLEKWMKEQGDNGLASEMEVPLWKSHLLTE